VHAMKAYGGWRYGSTHSAATLDGDEWSTLLQGRMPQSYTQWEAGWVPEPVWLLWRRVKSHACFEKWTMISVFQLLALSYASLNVLAA
jgi:hypothetical protein